MCVCVDGRPEATAREFQRLYFDRDMVNAFIDSRDDFPRFQTQLGCQGLVVVDADGRFATQRSPAFLDHRNAAFEVVENALRALAMRARATDKTPEFQTDSRTARADDAEGPRGVQAFSLFLGFRGHAGGLFLLGDSPTLLLCGYSFEPDRKRTPRR